jgi:hypothetical protein
VGRFKPVKVPGSKSISASLRRSNPSLLTAERADNVVNLVPKENSGETNLIVRFLGEDRETKVYQYRAIVQGN